MKRILVGLGALIIIATVVCMGCERGKVVVYISNQTMDNFKVNEGGIHVYLGEKDKYLTLLTIDEPTYTFEIWRSQGGHLADVYIGAIDLPDEEEPNISDTIVMMENPRNTFSAFTKKSHVTVDITNLQ